MEDADGNIFILDNIDCTPSFYNAASCTFDVTDETGTTSCTATAGTGDSYDTVCDGL